MDIAYRSDLATMTQEGEGHHAISGLWNTTGQEQPVVLSSCNIMTSQMDTVLVCARIQY
jgi:hypothetical protein